MDLKRGLVFSFIFVILLFGFVSAGLFSKSITGQVTLDSDGWTNWLDRDGPGGSGDWELLGYFSGKESCENPTAIECRTVSGKQTYSSTGEKVVCSIDKGFYCLNSENAGGCEDYEVRFNCAQEVAEERVTCAAPPAGCQWVGGTRSSCGELVCGDDSVFKSEPACVDSDGQNHGVKGTTTYGGKTYVDSCSARHCTLEEIDNGTCPEGSARLLEYACLRDGEQFAYATVGCLNGCADGACIEEGQSYCGDRVIDKGEQCDDGNAINGDGCSSSCEIETSDVDCEESGNYCTSSYNCYESGGEILNQSCSDFSVCCSSVSEEPDFAINGFELHNSDSFLMEGDYDRPIFLKVVNLGESVESAFLYANLSVLTPEGDFVDSCEQRLWANYFTGNEVTIKNTCNLNLESGIYIFKAEIDSRGSFEEFSELNNEFSQEVQIMDSDFFCSGSGEDVDYYLKGAVNGYNTTSFSQEIVADSCLDSSNLMEYYCESTNEARNGNIGRFRHECPNGCFDGACLPDNSTEGQCYDSDGEKNFYEKGHVITIDGDRYDDACSTRGGIYKNVVSDYRCTDSGFIAADGLDCPNGCFDGACIPDEGSVQTKEETCGSGCVLEEVCYPIGYRQGSTYCSPAGEFVNKVLVGETCDNNFECGSNVCVNNQCIEGNLFNRFLSWLRGSGGSDLKIDKPVDTSSEDEITPTSLVRVRR